jgi:hypothetical protein
MKPADLGRCHAPENPIGGMHGLPYIMQLLLCAVADPIHCSEPHTPRAKIVTDRTLPKFGLLSVSECDANFRCVLERNIQHTYMSTCSWSAHRNAPCRHQRELVH